MKLKFSILTILLFFLSASFPLAAQKAPQPFDIDTPSLRVFLPAPELATGRAIVACPGGGYGGLAVNHEGYDWAPYFNKQGIALIVLKYRMPHGDRTLRPNFQILFYPVITMDKSYTHIGSHDNLLGKDASAELETEFSNEKQVTKETPRAFIAYSDDDKTVPPANGVNYYLGLHKNHVPAVLHIYASGGHGWGIRENFIYKNEMLNDLSAWLRSFKAPRKDAVRVACVGNSITYGAGIKNRSHDSYPSVLGRLLGDKYWVKNFGVSARTMLNKGDRPYMKEQAYQQALAFNPNIVVIKLGTNDSKSFNWVHKADFIKDTQTMIDAFKALPSQPEIYLCYPSKAYLTGESINDDIISKEIIPMIKKVAKKNKLPVIDLHSAMDGMPELFPDHIHPNEEGAKVMAKAVYDAIAK